jgi:hypothetical protein
MISHDAAAVRCNALLAAAFLGFGARTPLSRDKLAQAIRSRMFHFDQQRLPNSADRLARVTTVLFLVRIRNVVQHVRKQYSPGVALIDAAFFPESDVQNAVLFSIGQPHPNHFKGPIIGRCIRRYGKFYGHASPLQLALADVKRLTIQLSGRADARTDYMLCAGPWNREKPARSTAAPCSALLRQGFQPPKHSGGSGSSGRNTLPLPSCLSKNSLAGIRAGWNSLRRNC